MTRSPMREGPVLVWRPEPGREVPLLFDSPHSGRDYPEAFAPVMPVEQLFGYEDRMVDDLLVDAPDHGILLLAASFPRSYIDPNRAIDDLDRSIVGEGWTESINPSIYSERGVGLVFRTALDGKPIYERPLERDHVMARIDTCWRPYHAALDQALDGALERWGAVWHVDWHSMRPKGDATAPDPGAIRPDFVIGDLHGTSAEPAFVAEVERVLRSLGYRVARNQPFAGGYITRKHGRPDEGRHSIQIEINRALYLDLDTLEPNEGSHILRSNLAAFAEATSRWVARRLG